MPKRADLARYAELFEVSVAYLLSGADAHLYEDQESVVSEEHGDINEDESAPINQASVKGDSKSSHNGEIRLIVKLSAGGVKKLSSEWGDLTKMSGQRLPVPAFIDAGPRTFWYQITEHDQSMVTSDSFSLTPGAIFLVDLDRPIMPGDHVCAYLEGFAEPVIRKYVASRPHSTGASFTLEARNPAYRPIEVPKDGHCRLIGRVIFYANPI
jgi:SOS-response transcriptional repressor LexA